MGRCWKRKCLWWCRLACLLADVESVDRQGSLELELHIVAVAGAECTACFAVRASQIAPQVAYGTWLMPC